MHLHEYQAKILFEQYGIPIPPFWVSKSLEEIEKSIIEFGDKELILKVQIHAGGRGKAGGIQRARGSKEILEKAKGLFGKKIINEQTGPSGKEVSALLLTLPVGIKKEYYISLLHDRERCLPLLVVSAEGGMEIEEVARKTPEKILKIPLDPQGRLRNFQALRAAKFLGWEGETLRLGTQILHQLAKAFYDLDATLMEINPLVLTPEGMLLALDAKCSLDENALFRHPTLADWEDLSQKSPSEQLAHLHNLAYISLEGDIGCLVNGAGLAMATMDLIQYEGGNPANFLDVGGGASMDKIAQGFQILLRDPKVKAIFVNIFGGILNCALLAQAIIKACAEEKLTVPLLMRLEGTHADEARSILAKSGLPIRLASSMEEGAKLAVRAAKGESWQS